MANRKNTRRMGRTREYQEESDGLYRVLKLQIAAALLLILCAWWCKGAEDYGSIREQAKAMLYCEQTPEVSEMAAVGIQTAKEHFDRLTAQVDAKVYEIGREEQMRRELTGQGGWNPFMPQEQTLEIPADASLAMVVTNALPLLPVEGYVTSVFGYRLHPITGKPDFHMGLDIAAAEGTAVLCALPGVVADRGVSEIYGNYLTVEHSGSFKTRYCHLSETVARTGDCVRQGARIGRVGSTGMSTGPHLHFDVIVDGKFTNPIWILEELREYRGTAYTSNRTVNA